MVDTEPRTTVRLGASRPYGRPIRTDDAEHLGVSTWFLLEDAIQRGDTTAAIRLLDYLHEGETAPRHFFFFDWLYGNQSYVVEQFGPEGYHEMFRAEAEQGQRNAAPGTLGGFPAGLLEDVEALVKRQAEIMRGHWPPRGGIIIVEESDRYVMNFFPCNSGGRMLRSGMTEGKWSLPVTREPYPWSWSTAGKPFYCLHCSLGRGIMAIEKRGIPIRLHDDPGSGFNPDRDHPFDPCRMVFYKDPALIPERYFTALGLVKDPDRFQVVPGERLQS